MNTGPILTIAIPTYNMEWCLKKNLSTYCIQDLDLPLEVIILNNCSSDRTLEIAQDFCQKFPQIFKLCNRTTKGYGSSINEALKIARGKYFRIIDADDWVDTEELQQFLRALKHFDADIIQTDYTIVDMQTGKKIPKIAQRNEIKYGIMYSDFSCALKTLPAIHSTTYRTELLREHGFYMQDETFFVDEEYIVLPFLYAETILYLPYNVYQYQVSNPEQSTSPRNRGKYAKHRERVIKRISSEFMTWTQLHPLSNTAKSTHAEEYCAYRIMSSVADHFTTLYIYVDNRKMGRILAKRWKKDLSFWIDFRCEIKIMVLSILNLTKITPVQYIKLKGVVKRLRGHLEC